MNLPMHIVAVGGLVTNSEQKILMVKHPLRGWEFPGGTVNIGETLTNALKREIQEETGIIVSIINLVGIHSNISTYIQNHKSTIINIDFKCTPLSGNLQTSPESLEVGWYDSKDALSMIKQPIIYDRLKFMLNFNGHTAYRAYIKNPYTIYEEQIFNNLTHVPTQTI